MIGQNTSTAENCDGAELEEQGKELGENDVIESEKSLDSGKRRGQPKVKESSGHLKRR